MTKPAEKTLDARNILDRALVPIAYAVVLFGIAVVAVIASGIGSVIYWWATR